MVQVRKLVLAIATASALSSGMANALGLGGLTVKSTLNQPLLAEIELTQVQDLNAAQVVPSLATSAEFAQAGVGRTAILDDLTFTPVIDAGDFLRDPEKHLRWLCEWLGIEFTDAMLHWPAGPRSSDGVWAAHWYDAVARSTGFEPWRPRTVDLNDHDLAVAEACRPAYDELHARRVRL